MFDCDMCWGKLLALYDHDDQAGHYPSHSPPNTQVIKLSTQTSYYSAPHRLRRHDIPRIELNIDKVLIPENELNVFLKSSNLSLKYKSPTGGKNHKR